MTHTTVYRKMDFKEFLLDVSEEREEKYTKKKANIQHSKEKQKQNTNGTYFTSCV